MLNKLKTFTCVDSEVSRFQSFVFDFTSQLTSKPQLDSRIIEGVELVSGTAKQIEHKLGRKLLGWQIIDIDSNANVWQPATATNKELFLKLQSSANCKISILVF